MKIINLLKLTMFNDNIVSLYNKIFVDVYGNNFFLWLLSLEAIFQKLIKQFLTSKLILTLHNCFKTYLKQIF